ncbi:hypothetical protein A2U01_0107789, partial [Trifolium medium]|nr:hypothetical protein [Trifolium medium]
MSESKKSINHVRYVTDRHSAHCGGIVILCVSQCVGIELLYPRNIAVADHGVKVHPP